MPFFCHHCIYEYISSITHIGSPDRIFDITLTVSCHVNHHSVCAIDVSITLSVAYSKRIYVTYDDERVRTSYSLRNNTHIV